MVKWTTFSRVKLLLTMCHNVLYSSSYYCCCSLWWSLLVVKTLETKSYSSLSFTWSSHSKCLVCSSQIHNFTDYFVIMFPNRNSRGTDIKLICFLRFVPPLCFWIEYKNIHFTESYNFRLKNKLHSCLKIRLLSTIIL